MLQPHSFYRRLKACLQVELLEARNLLSTNVPVNDPAKDTTSENTQSETSIVLNDDGQPVVAYNDSQEFADTGAHFTGYAYSTDGGASFIDAGHLPDSTFGDAGDPVLAVNHTNHEVYLTTLALSAGNVIQFFKSTDGGHTFGAPVNAFPRVGGFLDKEWITVDNFAGTGNGKIYASTTSFGASARILVSSSVNDGVNWAPQPVANGTVQGSNVVVGSDHAAYVFWLDGNQASRRILQKKTDSRGRFGRTSTLVATLRTTGTNGDLGLDFRSNAFPQVTVNPDGTNHANTIYLVYADKSLTSGDRGDIFFTQSTNGGSSWTTPVKVNDDATTADQWQPALAVTPDGTHLFVTWYDRRNAASQNGNIERFGVIGSISGSTVTFGGNFGYSDAPFPEVFGTDPIVVSNYMGDYDTAAADNSFFYTSFLDTRRGNQDVWFQKISVSGTSPASQTAWLVVNGASAALSQSFADEPLTGGALASGIPSNPLAHPPSQAELGRFALPGAAVSGGTAAAAVAGKKATLATASVDAVFAAVPAAQFQGYHHAGTPAGDSLNGWKPGTLD